MARSAPVRPPVKKKRRKSLTLRFLGFAFTAGVFVFLGGAAIAAYFLWQISQELPDYDSLARYKPAVVTRVHASDGRMIAEFAKERRIYVPITSIPKKVINAFLSAEDKNFYQHPGLDMEGIARAVYTNVVNMGKGRAQGASTITQQVAKNFLLTNERSIVRKIKEAILAVRIERAYTKDRILELYLNEIYLGLGAYGVAAASLTYFGKELHELNVEEVAYLAALPKAPSRYHPIKDRDRAIARRNWVIDRMIEDGHVQRADGEAAKARPITVTSREVGPTTYAAEYFAEQVRRSLLDLYGEGGQDGLYTGGYSVRSTLDPALQAMARTALREGLVNYDRRQGWRGPVTKIEVGAGDWGVKLAEIEPLSDIDPWRLAVVLDVSAEGATLGLQPAKKIGGVVEKERDTAQLTTEGVKWAFEALAGKTRGKTPTVADVLAPGDVVYVSPPSELDVMQAQAKVKKKGETVTAADLPWQLMQIPEIEGAIVVLDPHTGRILALAGGFSFAESQFDRAVQAKRQPGSSYKPFVYAAALDNGYTPSSIVNDSVLSIEQGGDQGVWRPSNYDGKIHGPSTLRVGIEKSRNLMTVRLAQDLGMPIISEYSRRFGIYDDLPPLLSMALGAGETTLLRLTTAYSMFVNGGKQVRPTFIDRIQDRFGKTVWRHDMRPCDGCASEEWRGQDEPRLIDDRKQIIDPHTAYQITSMLEGVVIRGTGTKVAAVGKPLAGKTGTTNDEKDAWFVGFSPDLAVGVFMGFDNPRAMGKGETGGENAAPVFRDFFKLALKDQPAVPFRLPEGIKLVRVNKKTGLRASPDDPDAILEAFKPGTEPADPFSYAGYGSDGGGSAWGSGPGGWGANPTPRSGGGYGGYDGGSPPFGRSPQAGGLY